ncbi:hypothetical protein HGA88_03730 [Candidatus Roizmanbacteria bacterium]|nr:hypothetical protein [Candidatus Roizmanbacteria bacterium]
MATLHETHTISRQKFLKLLTLGAASVQLEGASPTREKYTPQYPIYRYSDFLEREKNPQDIRFLEALSRIGNLPVLSDASSAQEYFIRNPGFVGTDGLSNRIDCISTAVVPDAIRSTEEANLLIDARMISVGHHDLSSNGQRCEVYALTSSNGGEIYTHTLLEAGTSASQANLKVLKNGAVLVFWEADKKPYGNEPARWVQGSLYPTINEVLTNSPTEITPPQRFLPYSQFEGTPEIEKTIFFTNPPILSKSLIQLSFHACVQGVDQMGEAILLNGKKVAAWLRDDINSTLRYIGIEGNIGSRCNVGNWMIGEAQWNKGDFSTFRPYLFEKNMQAMVLDIPLITPFGHDQIGNPRIVVDGDYLLISGFCFAPQNGYSFVARIRF